VTVTFRADDTNATQLARASATGARFASARLSMGTFELSMADVFVSSFQLSGGTITMSLSFATPTRDQKTGPS
jgi:hypothetical protein